MSGVEQTRLRDIALLFLRLGVTAFGERAAHIAMMEDEVVRRRSWLTHEEFLDLLGAANLIPGPDSTELAIHIGHRRAGFAGLWSPDRASSFRRPSSFWPVIIAVVPQALSGRARTAIRDRFLAAIAIAAARRSRAFTSFCSWLWPECR